MTGLERRTLRPTSQGIGRVFAVETEDCGGKACRKRQTGQRRMAHYVEAQVWIEVLEHRRRKHTFHLWYDVFVMEV
jgi:hypothetical protein